MTTSTKTKPAFEVRLGRIKATVWKNDTERGDRFNTTFKRVYRLQEDDRKGSEDNGWRETESFGREDLLLLGKLADQVHTWIHEQSESNRHSGAA